MKSTSVPPLPGTTTTPAPTAPTPAAKPLWSPPAVQCHRTGAEVTAYAARTTR
ncbi:hypothetical protein ACIRS1_27430 [Kitasatospora sp. NPDC101176]|uniref:hypothetical protein n=1 Tax=Kitasatospora sp. NPDC101176 TaxID=3364099 RepID=UPI003800F5FC